MSKEMLPLALGVALLMGAGSAYADQNDNNGHHYGQIRHSDNSRNGQVHVAGVSNPVPQAVPEIDANSGFPALAFVLGVALLGAERLRRQPQRDS